LVVDDRQVAWGECLFSSAESERDGRLNVGVNDALHILQEIIIPALMGQPLTNIAALMSQIDEMRHDVTIVKPITADTPPQKRSRRELFSSLLNPEEGIREVVERPLPPELRNGVSQALLSAAAMVQDVLIVETIADMYSLNPARSPLPIHLVFDEVPNTADPALARITAVSYGLTVGDGDPLAELGNNGVRLQNRVRQLKNRAASTINNNLGPNHRGVGFLFDLKGGYGRLYEENSGQILGALYGLEQKVKGFSLRVVDPVIMDDRQSQIAMMRELKEFIRFRKMGVGLIGRAWLETAEDIHALADNDCCDGVLLDMAQLGTLHRAIELAKAARERELAVIVAGVEGKAAVHAALALNPALLAVKVGEVSAVADEMNRTLAWLEYKTNN
jgi:methylaspartate ammonia-lyase